MLDPQATLYHRLGGYDALAAFVDDFLPRVTSDPQIGVYWKGKCKDSMRRDRQLLVDFLCAATGGPSTYIGRDMKTSHEGLGISDSDWDILMRYARTTFDDLGVAENEKNEALSAVDSLKGEIVEVHGTAKAAR